MDKPRITIQHGFYILAFALALSVRFVNLGSQPLSEFEAVSAMQAFDLAEGEPSQIGAQPAYTLLTGFLFIIFGSSEFLARLLPALLGSLLVWLPFIFRNKLGEKAALTLTFAIALDPTLVGLSRLAGGPMLAYGFGLMAGAAWLSKRPILTGILTGMTLLSGPVALAGIFSLALAWALSRLFDLGRRRVGKGLLESFWNQSGRTILISTATTLLLAGTLFLRYPQGLSALGASIPGYFTGWISPTGAPITQLFVALAAYQPLALLLGLISVLRNWRQPRASLQNWLGFWLLATFLLTFFYPARQVSDLIWVLAPLWTLAALEIGRHINWNSSDGLPVWGQASLTLLLLTFLAMYTARVSMNPLTTGLNSEILIFGFSQQALTTMSILGMGIVSTILIAAGWSKKAASHGLVWGISTFLAIYMFSTSWNSAISKTRSVNELWFPGPSAGNVAQMANTVAEFSQFFTGNATSLEVAYQVDLASLRWMLRKFPAAGFNEYLAPEEAPAAVITSETSQDPRLSAFYRGQSFSWSFSPNWSGDLPENLQRWWIFRDAPTISDNLILWLRSDIFPEDLSSASEFLPPFGQTAP